MFRRDFYTICNSRVTMCDLGLFCPFVWVSENCNTPLVDGNSLLHYER